jgi:hypothetical protein
MQCICRVIFQQWDKRKTGLQKIALICLLSLVISFLSPVSLTMAAIDVAEKMDSIKNISFPVLFISIVILLYSIVRLLEYRRAIIRRTLRNPIPTKKNGMGIEIIEKDETFRDVVKSISGERKENIVEEQTPPELQTISSLNFEVANKYPRNTIQERRQYQRMKVEHMEVNSEMPSATYMKIIDISKSGVLVNADRKLDIGKKYALKIEYENKVLVVRAAVVWSLFEDNVEDANGNIIPIYIAGMHFTDVLKGEITRITSLIEIDINTSMYVSVL